MTISIWCFGVFSVVTDLKGEIVGEELAFSLNFGDYPTSFKGRIENVKSF